MSVYFVPFAGPMTDLEPLLDLVQANGIDVLVSRADHESRADAAQRADHRVLFGTDFPWWKPERAVEFVNSVLDEEERGQVMRANAKALFMR